MFHGPLRLALILGVLAVCAPTMRAQGDTLPYEVPRLDAIVVDGDDSDWKGRGLRIELLADHIGEVRAADDLSASLRLGWNEHGLLVLATVRDDQLVEGDEPDRFDSHDALVLHMATTPQPGADMIRVVVSPGGSAVDGEVRWSISDHRHDETLRQAPVALTAARTKTKDGYLMEVVLPWTSLGVEPRVGIEFGAQAGVSDRDADGDVFRAVWHPGRGVTSFVQRMRLADQAGPPVAAAMRLSYESTGLLRAKVIGIDALMGKDVSLRSEDAILATGRFTSAGGRASAWLTADLGPGQAVPANLRVVVDERTVARSDQTLIVPPPLSPDHALFGSRIQRTMTLLATSNMNRRNPVKILFYGQSITLGPWPEMVAAELHNRFPWADLTVENRALGGFEADRLVRTAAYDVYPFYPDLIVFHAYGGEHTGELERIISNIRRYTTSEIVLLTHHAPVDNATYDRHSDVIRRLAHEYHCELVEVREQWRQYLDDQQLEPAALLTDAVHPNDLGHQLLATLVGRHFRYRPHLPAAWSDMVRTYEARRLVDEGVEDEITFTGAAWEQAPWKNSWDRQRAAVVGTDPESALKLTFQGNRVDVVVGVLDGELGSATVLIDGKPPSSNPRLYTVTRPTLCQAGWWPGVCRVGNRSPLQEEDWLLRVSEISDDSRRFTYEVIGSRTGPDGTGSSDAVFVSDSGRVVIEPRDFTFSQTFRVTGIKCPPGFEVRWQVVPLFADVYRPQPIRPATERPAGSARYPGGIVPFHNAQNTPQIITLAQGLTNDTHTLELVPNGDGPVPVEQIIVYRPPLRQVRP